jgi:DNA uptake protein ComE-like DNA-binding protein
MKLRSFHRGLMFDRIADWGLDGRSPIENPPSAIPNRQSPIGQIQNPQSKIHNQKGSVLIIVLWVAFGLVSLALYFAHAMSFELRAADQRVGAIEAEAAIVGAVHYLTNVLARVDEPGMIPDPQTYRTEGVPVGDATFWFIGRSDRPTPDLPAFGLVDEASKLNLNTATREMLEALPRMTPELAGAIIDWRDSNEEVTDNGAESTTYQRLNPAYRCKNTNFESVAELRLVNGALLDVLYGEDANQNGVLDVNENDGETATPMDNRDGRLDAGVMEYLTVYSRQSANGTNVSNTAQLQAMLEAKLSRQRAAQVMPRVSGVGSVLEFYLRSGLTREEFVQVEGSLIGTNLIGLVNVNTASEAVLTCIPGIGTANASKLVSARQSNADRFSSLAWVKDSLEEADALRAAPYVTGRTYQFSADIAAVGHYGRGYRRVKVVIDTSDGSFAIRYRQDLTSLGWSLGRQVRDNFLLAKQIR